MTKLKLNKVRHCVSSVIKSLKVTRIKQLVLYYNYAIREVKTSLT